MLWCSAVDQSCFDAHYYRHCCGKPYVRNEEWLQFFGSIADVIARDIAPRRVLDAGCAIGLLVETLRSKGIDATGFDVSSFAIDQVAETLKPFCWKATATDELEERYDLIVCVEVLEHMSKPDAEAAIGNFCRHSDDVLFSSSPLDYREATHVNVHPPEYWAELFGRHGFFRDVDFDASFITPWAVRFRKRRDPLHRIIADYERRYSEVARERGDLRDAAIRLERANAELERLGLELSQARDRILHMERSAFWKLRRLWAWISGR